MCSVVVVEDKQKQNIEELEVGIFHSGLYNPTNVQLKGILYNWSGAFWA